jgi:hypothetical protein
VLAIGAGKATSQGAIGTTRILGREFNTTGVLGVSSRPTGSCRRAGSRGG